METASASSTAPVAESPSEKTNRAPASRPVEEYTRDVDKLISRISQFKSSELPKISTLKALETRLHEIAEQSGQLSLEYIERNSRGGSARQIAHDSTTAKNTELSNALREFRSQRLELYGDVALREEHTVRREAITAKLGTLLDRFQSNIIGKGATPEGAKVLRDEAERALEKLCNPLLADPLGGKIEPTKLQELKALVSGRANDNTALKVSGSTTGISIREHAEDLQALIDRTHREISRLFAPTLDLLRLSKAPVDVTLDIDSLGRGAITFRNPYHESSEVTFPIGDTA
ncbi:MAG: hypothetical protein EBZ48_08335 [Proteobacteria bacterium]|nr:hypothetical protein [Pseudomonadota bacterium]